MEEGLFLVVKIKLMPGTDVECLKADIMDEYLHEGSTVVSIEFEGDEVVHLNA